MSESTPSLAEMTAPKAAPVATSFERSNGKTNFTPLPKESLKDLEAQALRATDSEMNAAIQAKSSKAGSAETTPSTPPLSKPPPSPEMPPPFTATQLAEAREELQQAKASGQGTAAEHAQFDQALMNMEKQLGLSEKAVVPKVAPVEKRVSSNVAANKSQTVAKASAETKVESGSKQSLLTKIANLAEKIFSIPITIFKNIVAWITK